MLNRTRHEDLPADLANALRQTEAIAAAYLEVLSFVIHDTARDPNYAKNHLLSYLAQDFLQSAVSVISLAMEGLLCVAKRELRFVIEASIKLCFVQQRNYGALIADKLVQFDKELSSQRISIKDNLTLRMLPEPLRPAFTEEVGRLYGLTSGYVHLTPAQIQERIAAVNAGRTAGLETAAEISDLNRLTLRALAASLVLIFHAVPEYVAGDWFVEADGSTVKSRFTASRFLSAMDAFFDYKHERQERLAEIVAAREANISF